MSSPSSIISFEAVSGTKILMTFSKNPEEINSNPFSRAFLATADIRAVFGSRVFESLTNSIPIIPPNPRMSPTYIEFLPSFILAAQLRIFSPISTLRSRRFSFSITCITATPAAHAIGLPAYVPPRPPGPTLSITSARPTTPDNGSPPPKLFPTAIMSGITPLCSMENHFPVRAKPL